METTGPISWGETIHYLKFAAFLPHRRGEMLARALQEFLTCLPAVGTALIWPCQDRKVPWKVYYVGMRQESMYRWLSARLDLSLDTTLGVLQHDLSNLSEMPFPQIQCLQPSPTFLAGLWITWTTLSPLPAAAVECLERVRRTLEAVLQVEDSEEHYFSRNSPLHDQTLIQALGHGEADALSVFLGLTRVVGNAEFTFWGRAYRDVIVVTQHLGAQQDQFGFELQRGRGVGGRIATYGTSIVLVDDYRNSPYRDPSVTDTVDSEHIRSAIALPVRSTTGTALDAEVAAILYVTRRIVAPFSLAERLLIQRLARTLEPLPLAKRPSVFLSPGLSSPSEWKANWYDLVLHATRIENLENWTGQFIRGTVIVTNNEGYPYVQTRATQLEQLRVSLSNPTDAVQVLSLNAPGVSLPGQIYLRGSIPLPPADWPDFFTDLVMACNLVIGRMEKAHDQLAHQRERWLHALLQEKALQQIHQDGYRLSLPIEQGQIWVIAWPAHMLPANQLARRRLLAESVVLDLLKNPLLFFDEDIGVILLSEHIQQQPSRLRDALLKLYAPHPLWIVYGAHYHSLHELKPALTRTIALAQKARREASREYLLDAQTPDLESLLENPRLIGDLRDFAARLLAPLIEHDTTKGTHLTTTFVLAQTLGSVQAVADLLEVHVNTIRYRLHKGEDLLGIEHASPKERVAWALAAFTWESFHLREQMSD